MATYLLLTDAPDGGPLAGSCVTSGVASLRASGATMLRIDQLPFPQRVALDQAAREAREARAEGLSAAQVPLLCAVSDLGLFGRVFSPAPAAEHNGVGAPLLELGHG